MLPEDRSDSWRKLHVKQLLCAEAALAGGTVVGQHRPAEESGDLQSVQMIKTTFGLWVPIFKATQFHLDSSRNSSAAKGPSLPRNGTTERPHF